MSNEWLDGDIRWCDHLGFGGSLTLGDFKCIQNWLELSVSEDEADVQLDIWDELLQKWVRLLLQITVDEGLLAEHQFCLTVKKSAQVSELNGLDVVNVDHDDLGISFENKVHLLLELRTPLLFGLFTKFDTGVWHKIQKKRSG